MVIELLPNGDLYGHVSTSKEFPQAICRLYFKELCDIIGYLHSNNYCHRDLKLDNIMLDSEYHLKLCDFGFSVLAQKDEDSLILNSYCGTELYMAPEISLGKY